MQLNILYPEGASCGLKLAGIDGNKLKTRKVRRRSAKQKMCSFKMRGAVFLALLGHVMGKLQTPPFIIYWRSELIFFCKLSPFKPTSSDKIWKASTFIIKIVDIILFKHIFSTTVHWIYRYHLVKIKYLYYNIIAIYKYDENKYLIEKYCFANYTDLIRLILFWDNIFTIILNKNSRVNGYFSCTVIFALEFEKTRSHSSWWLHQWMEGSKSMKLGSFPNCWVCRSGTVVGVGVKVIGH